jgi:hypothetical protein
MNVSENILPEYYKFLDTHMSLKVLDFHLSKSTDENKKGELLKTKKLQLLKTKLYSEIYKFFEENPSFKNEQELITLKQTETKLNSHEEDLKDKIIGFLNIVNNIKNDPTFDFTTPINKKIVFLFLNFLF